MKLKPLVFILLVWLSLEINAQQSLASGFFSEADAFFQQNVENGRIDYAALKENSRFSTLVKTIEEANLSGADAATRQAFYINAYNLLVINEVLNDYPIASVQEVGGFFDRRKVTVAGEELTLNELEKEKLLRQYGDPRFHFVLVCAAISCPPITNFAYRPKELDQQLEQQTQAALNDPAFIRLDPTNGTAEISRIFQWYAPDFGGGLKKAVSYINEYREIPIPPNYKVSFYEYDWTLNEVGNNVAVSGISPVGANASRYVVSSTIPEGSVEIKWFNNLYTQRTGSNGELNNRSSFLTSSVSALYGLNQRLNVGIELRYRQVRNDQLPSSALEALIPRDDAMNRFGLTGIGPKIRWAPVRAWGNFSIQSAFLFTPGDQLKGSATQPFIDWDGAIWFTQVFNDFAIGNQFALFAEIDLWFEDFGTEDNFSNQISTPMTVIFSYFPNPKTTLYVLTNYAPIWSPELTYFAQAGLGAKYQFTPNVELELLYSRFTNEFLQDSDGKAATYNLGLRFNL